MPHDLTEGMAEVRNRVPCAIAANEALGREVDVLRIIESRCADVLCFSPYWVGSMRRFITLSHVAALHGLQICKHTHGELGIAAAAGQHLMLCVPTAVDGNQQTESLLADDVLCDPIPIREKATWGPIDEPGLGIRVNEEQLRKLHEDFLREGQFLPYRQISI